MSSSKKEYLSKIKADFYNQLQEEKENFKPTKELTTHSTIPIMTSKNYPYISAMQVTNSSIENSQFHQNEFVKKDYSHILSHKARSIVGTTNEFHKTNHSTKINEQLQELYASKKPIQSTHTFQDEIKIGKVLSSKVAGLLGNSTQLESISVDDNISILKLIEKHKTGETKSKDAILELYYKGFDDNQIRSLLSLSLFGLDQNKVLVPTKWSISACDSVIEQDLYEKVSGFNISNEFEIFEHEDKGNHFILCFLPYNFCSEVIETWPEGSGWALERDFVKNNNKLQTKEPECAGGYWATKLGMLEYLHQKRKQAACISIRVISGYDIPLGVIFVRECVREAIKKGSIFKTQNEAEFFEYIKTNFKKHSQFLKSSPVLEEVKKFKTINKWI